MKALFKIILLFVLVLFCGFQVYAQEKIKIYAGLSMPEQFVFGPRFQLNRVEIGLGFGNSRYRSAISGDIAYHFGKNSPLSEIKPWYIKGGVSKWTDHSDNPDSNIAGLYFRGGGDINFSRRVGMNIEFGIVTGKMAEFIAYSGYPKVYPCWGMFLFYRI